MSTLTESLSWVRGATDRGTKARPWLRKHGGDLRYAVGTMLTSAVAFGTSLVAARFVRPAEMGIIQTLLLIPAYLSFLHFGVFNGLNRNLAVYAARGENAKVQEMVNGSWWVAHRVACAGAAASLLLAAFYWFNNYPALYLWGMTFIVCALVAEPYSQQMEMVYLSSRNFRSLGTVLLWQNGITALTGLLPAVVGVAGVILSRIAYISARFAFRWRSLPLRAKEPGSWAETRDLAVTGLPLLVAGTLYTYLSVADRSVVAWRLGETEVGHLTLATLVVTALMFVPQCLAVLFYPRVAAHYGRTSSARALRVYFWRLFAVNVAVLVPLCLAAYWLVSPITRRFLPAYVPGIPAAELAALSCLSLVYVGLTVIIAVVRRNTPYIGCIAFSLGLVWVLGSWLITQGYGIEGAVWARTAASAVLCAFTIGYAYWLTGFDRVDRVN